MNRLLDAIDWLFRRTLRSVVFGIVLMVMLAAYVAVGSGLPAVREFFELDELGFFKAWPLKTIMVLLVANLVTVTLQRIPFTPPRYGVWMVHVGIVTLIAGMGWHYGHKVEGSALLIKGRTATGYYDRYERALYFQAGGSVTRVPLPSLPRFGAYAAEHDNAAALDRSDLQSLSPVMGRIGDGSRVLTAADAAGAKSLAFSVTGYWPYAHLRERIVEDPKQNRVGFRFNLPDADDGEPHDRILTAGLPRYAKISWGAADLEHRELPDPASVLALIDKARAAHTLVLKIGAFEQKAPVQVGDVVKLGDSGYSIRIESFNPQWQTIDKKIVPKLTFLVASPTQTYRRMTLAGGPGQSTDFKLGDAGAGPMGKRQKELLDPAFDVQYTYDAHASLLPVNGLGRVLFLTTPQSRKTTVMAVEANGPVAVKTFEGDVGHVDVSAPLTEDATLMASIGRPSPRDTFHLDVTRTEHLAAVEGYVEPVPPITRTRDEGTSGRRQVVRVRYEGIDSTDKPFDGSVLVPFSEHPFETPWQGGLVNVPNASSVVQVQLGNTWRKLPAVARLDRLEALAYAGMDPAANSIIRDYRSTITLTDPESGKTRTDTVFLNSPVFYGGNDWIFYQASFDIDKQQWSVLGVGNRPGTYVMMVGCGLIIVGIFYAFYIKPVIVRRMKRQALANAHATARKPQALVGGAA